jgi:hypothetical protein
MLVLVETGVLCLLSCYGLLMWIHTYFVSFGLVMDIIAQIHACMSCEAL